MPGASDIPDWRDGSAYAPLMQVDRAMLAWEWLRRSRDYRAAAAGKLPPGSGMVRTAQPMAARWGLHLFEDPGLSAPEARPVWSRARHPFVLGARAEPSPDDDDALILDRLAGLSTLARAPDFEALLLSDGRRCIRLDVHGHSLLEGPARLQYCLEGLKVLGAPLLTLRRLAALAAAERFSRVLHRADPRARRHVLLLRAHDALEAGASQRAIAAGLLSRDAAADRWRVRNPSLRSQAQRLVHGARRMAAGDFWRLLQ